MTLFSAAEGRSESGDAAKKGAELAERLAAWSPTQHRVGAADAANRLRSSRRPQAAPARGDPRPQRFV